MNNEYKTAKDLHKIINDLQLELQNLKVEKRRHMFKNKECKEYMRFKARFKNLRLISIRK